MGMVFASLAALGIPFNVVIYGEFTNLLVERSVPDSGVSSTPTIVLDLFGGGEVM